MDMYGFIEKINREVLHPLGLAMTRNPETAAAMVFLFRMMVNGRTRLK